MPRTSAAGPSATDVVVQDRYRIERLLGEGGMGAVYVVLDSATDRRVALKRLHVSRDERGATASALFAREFQTLSGLRHPGIVEVYDYGCDEQGPYYTMELVESEDLSKHAPLPWREVCTCLRDAASILGVLHARRLLHRDLSPRNLLRAPDGRLKLIDFGALAHFGVNREIVGTPPFLPPEVLRGEALDQRSDLFALGALGYWLLTGVHAFAARTIRELSHLHERTPALPSLLVAMLAGPGQDPVPAALDALLLALLRSDLRERPTSTGELIDRLNALAELPPELSDAHGYLDSKVFVGREREREHVFTLLDQARQGQLRAVLVEAAPGLGRTRLLQELAIGAQLSGAVTISVGATDGEHAFGAASAIAVGLLSAMPSEAREAARPHAAELAQASPRLCEWLGVQRVESFDRSQGEARVRLQLALREWILQLAVQRSIVVLVDDAHAIDEQSRALLASLAHGPRAGEVARPLKLLLIVSTSNAERVEPSASLANLRGEASRLELSPLTAPETQLLLRSMFGPVAFLERSAERLFRVTGGHPAYTVELARHLIRSGLARYVDGTWHLPSELDESALPRSRQEAHEARVASLSHAARALAYALSIPSHGELTRGDVQALSAQSESETSALLHELVQEGILRESARGYGFAHDSVQSALHDGLSTERRMRSQLALGRARLTAAAGDRLATLRASLHLFRGGAVDQSLALMRTCGLNQTYETLHQTARAFEEAYLLMVAHGSDGYARAAPLSTLALASYHVDRRYVRYAEDARQTFDAILRLPLARSLARFIGKKLALLVALLVAGVGRLGRRAHAPSLKQLVQHCMRAMVALAGTTSCCLDPKSGRRYADTLAPFAALGADHGASLAYRLGSLFVDGVEDHQARSVEKQRAMIALIESEVPAREVTPEVRREALAGCLYVMGVHACWRDDDEALAIADRLDSFSPLYAMSADYLRSNYHAGQGDVERAEQYRKRVELHAVQLGNTWQVETWMPADASRTALRTNDAMLAKRAAEQLARLAVEVPSLAREERHARGTYLMLRGKYEQAATLLEVDDAPQAIVGWARTRGSLARCYNGLGRHTCARAVCTDALARLTPADLAYVGMNLSLQIELALAEAALGNLELAKTQLEALIAQHQPQRGALTLGALHAARCRLALREGALDLAREQLGEMEGWLRPTGISSLCDLVDELQRDLRAAERRQQGLPENAELPPEQSEQLLHSRLQSLSTEHGGTSLPERAHKALLVAIEVTGAKAGFIVHVAQRERPLLLQGADAPDAALHAWATDALTACSVDEATAIDGEPSASSDVYARSLGQLHYMFFALWTGRAVDAPVAGLVLAFESATPRIPDPIVLRALAMHVRG